MFIVESHATIRKERKGKVMILLKSWNKNAPNSLKLKIIFAFTCYFTWTYLYYGINWLVFVVEYKSTF